MGFGDWLLERGVDLAIPIAVAGARAAPQNDEVTGNGGGSSRWESWGHQEMYDMVNGNANPEIIRDGSLSWDRADGDGATAFADDLDNIVANGWRGASADAATNANRPVRIFGDSMAEGADSTRGSLDGAAGGIEDARREIPEPVAHSWAQDFRGGLVSLLTPADGMVQASATENAAAQEEARLRAVDVMNGRYSPPVAEARAPVFPMLADPTNSVADPSAAERPPGSASAPPSVAAGGAGGGYGGTAPSSTAGQSFVPPTNPGVPGGGPPGGAPGAGTIPGPSTGTPPWAPGGTPGSPGGRPGGGQPGSGQPGGGRPGAGHTGTRPGTGQPGGTQPGRPGSGAASGRGAGTGPGPFGRGVGPGGSGATGGPGPGPRTGVGGFGPTGGAAGGAAAGAAGRAGAAGMGGAPMGGGGGRRDDDSERTRPSWLVESEDFYSDPTMVAPAVFGVDEPDEHTDNPR